MVERRIIDNPYPIVVWDFTELRNEIGRKVLSLKDLAKRLERMRAIGRLI